MLNRHQEPVATNASFSQIKMSFLRAKTKDNPQVHRKHKVQLKVNLQASGGSE